MRRASYWLIALGSCVTAAGAFAADPPVSPASFARDDQRPATSSTPADPELQKLLDRLSQLSEQIARDARAEQAWRYQLAQGEVLHQLAIRCKGEERDRWLRMAVDSYYSAVVQGPATETTALAWLAQIPARIASDYPDSPVAAYAALRDIRGRYNRAMVRAGDNSVRVQEHYCTLLERFAREHAKSEEAPKAVMEAAGTWESLSRPDEARRCYRSLIEAYSGREVARQACAALSRLGLDREPVRLKLPLLFSAGDQLFDLDELRGKVVIVYFWSSTGAQAADFHTLKQLYDHNRARGLEVVQVNLDADPAKGRQFLSGLLTIGDHLHQGGGLASPLAERYGIQSLPQTFLVSRDGKLLHQARQPSEIEAAVTGNLGGGR